MRQMHNVDYSELFRLVKDAKKRKVTHDLEGEIRKLIYYLYSEIIDSIQNERFRIRTSDVRVKLFEIEVEYHFKIHIETLHKYSRIVKIFMFQSKEEMEFAFKEIKRAMELITLDAEFNEEEKLIEVFWLISEREP